MHGVVGLASLRAACSVIVEWMLRGGPWYVVGAVVDQGRWWRQYNSHWPDTLPLACGLKVTRHLEQKLSFSSKINFYNRLPRRHKLR